MSVRDLARPEIAALSAYQAAAQVEQKVRLNANESPIGPAVGNFRRPLNRYPEVRPRNLSDALARRFGCNASQLLVTRGSSEAIDLLIRTFCRAGNDSIATLKPSFSMYRHYAHIQGASVVEVAMSARDDFAIDIASLCNACDDNTRIVFVCSPNNPTGTSLPRSDLEALLNDRQGKSIVVVDEAYIEFGEDASAIELLDRYDNLVVLRTLSKALGFAGARCGVAIANNEVIDLLDAVQAPYALATPVVECVEDALQSAQLEAAATVVANVVAERTRLSDTLANYSFVTRVWPSQANFLLIRCRDSALLMQHCNAHDVLLRDFAGDLENCIRISVGSRTENDRLLRALDLLEGAGQ